MPILASLFVAATLGGPLPPPADHLVNPDFDTNPITAEPVPAVWRIYLDQGSGGNLSWDTSVGTPAAGSARVRNNRSGARYDHWGQCVKLAPGPFTLRAAVAAQVKPAAACELRIAVLNQPDCNSTAIPLLDLHASPVTNGGGFETVQIAQTAPAAAGAAWVFLGHRQTFAAAVGESYCHFDHVELVGNPVFAQDFGG